jgi:GT2 family glycosyltransferase
MRRSRVADLPRVSVLIPCYNLGEYVDEAIRSVLAQTFQDFEIIIVDDGSTDEATRAVLAGCHQPSTRVIRIDHGGLAHARNVGVTHARGEYLCALDADDRLDASFLAKTVAVLESDPSVTFVSAWLRMFGTEEWEWKPERCDVAALLCEDTVLTAALVRREAVVAVGGYDTAMPVQGDEDWDLWLTLVERGYRGVILREVLFDYRRRVGSMSSVSWYGSGHLTLARYRIAKHAEAYRAHLVHVLLHQDTETCGLLRRNDEIERYLATELEPAVAARRAELAMLRSRLASAAQVPAAGSMTERADDSSGLETGARLQLEAALRAAEREVAAVRASSSWRITSPLRAVYGWWLQQRRPS